MEVRPVTVVPWWLYCLGFMLVVGVVVAIAEVVLVLAAAALVTLLIVCAASVIADKIVNRRDPGAREAEAELRRRTARKLDLAEDTVGDEARARAALYSELVSVRPGWPYQGDEEPTLEFSHPDQEALF